jgi:transcriptional regulator with XRE-family HTH domain
MRVVLRYNPRAIRTLRLEQGIDTDALGRRARVTGRAVRLIEAGSTPRADTLGKLASALGVQVGAFYVERVKKNGAAA